MVRRAAVSPRLLLLLAGVVAGPEEGFAAGEPVEERVAAVAGVGAAGQFAAGRPVSASATGSNGRRSIWVMENLQRPIV